MSNNPQLSTALKLAFIFFTLAAGVLFTACDGPREFRGVYEEQLPLESGRRWALRLTLMEFAGEVGGFAAWYPLDGERNTVAQPYFVRESCVAFGPSDVRGAGFLVEVRTPSGGLFRARLYERGSANSLVAEVIEDGGLWDEPPPPELARLNLERVNVHAEWRECAPPRSSGGEQ